ncbi:WecB/TagA/CpsF family glycosyltransferase [Mucilaginibacter paludis]|uniref:Glycosyl transferase, WecB/TagA/CpsF family n=1 Tax=Mucilaginibacter paludis DSM 18603 TaxID=714943 RepID=H1Y8U7_9SPHI|nr:WecB/TagA/CpsF family glycosyltransferase [Mucilaginibacter paludis]EHQ28713.1 glycosyl transferase, WecB/TagA/CpsF family [Mucilaginibacter paludis DSM 18603]
MKQTRHVDNFIDYSLYTNTLEELSFQSPLLVNTINQYSYCMANEDAGFKESLQMSDILLPDGISIVAAEYLLTGNKIKKISGADLHHHLLKDLNEKSGSCFYLGASESTLNKIRQKLAIEFPNVKVGTYSPPFKKHFSPDDDQKMVEAVNLFKPDVLFIGMTAPKQEIWAYKHKDNLQAKTICTIGAVFDFYAGTIKRAPNFLIRFGLEWLGRLLKEPKRMWKRYLYYGPVFIALMLKERVKKTFFNRYILH